MNAILANNAGMKKRKKKNDSKKEVEEEKCGIDKGKMTENSGKERYRKIR